MLETIECQSREVKDSNWTQKVPNKSHKFQHEVDSVSNLTNNFVHVWKFRILLRIYKILLFSGFYGKLLCLCVQIAVFAKKVAFSFEEKKRGYFYVLNIWSIWNLSCIERHLNSVIFRPILVLSLCFRFQCKIGIKTGACNIAKENENKYEKCISINFLF